MVNVRLQGEPRLAGFQLGADMSWVLAIAGQQYAAADADQNDRVTGQTSFANTTPTFLLDNPAGSGVLVLGITYNLTQTGTVAGGDIFIENEIVYPSAYASGGTSERTRSLRIGNTRQSKARLFSGATATAGYGINVAPHYTLAPDVSPAEGVINVLEWTSPAGLVLDPNSSLNVFTYAGTTGPTWQWGFTWWEVPIGWAKVVEEMFHA